VIHAISRTSYYTIYCALETGSVVNPVTINSNLYCVVFHNWIKFRDQVHLLYLTLIKVYTLLLKNNKNITSSLFVVSTLQCTDVAGWQEWYPVHKKSPPTTLTHYLVGDPARPAKGNDTLESFVSKVAFKSDLRKKTYKNRTCSNRESLFPKEKKLRKFSWHTCKIPFESHFRQLLSKENFLVCHYL